MKANEIFSDYKQFPKVENDQATAQFKAVTVMGEYDFPNTVIYHGTLECGHRASTGYSNYESHFVQHPDVTLENILEVVNVNGMTPAEVQRAAIRRCDAWFAACEADLETARTLVFNRTVAGQN